MIDSLIQEIRKNNFANIRRFKFTGVSRYVFELIRIMTTTEPYRVSIDARERRN